MLPAKFFMFGSVVLKR